MKRALIGVTVGALSIGAAVLLFPSPDTGAEIAPLPPEPVIVEPIAQVSPAQAEEPRPVVAMRAAKKDVREQLEARREAPESQAASQLASPIGAIRFALRKTGDERALALSQSLAVPQRALVQQRRSPDATTFGDTLSAVDTALEDVRTGPWSDHPDVATALERYDALRADL